MQKEILLDINKFLNHKVTKITKQHVTWRAVFYRSLKGVSFGRRFFVYIIIYTENLLLSEQTIRLIIISEKLLKNLFTFYRSYDKLPSTIPTKEVVFKKASQ